VRDSVEAAVETGGGALLVAHPLVRDDPERDHSDKLARGPEDPSADALVVERRGTPRAYDGRVPARGEDLVAPNTTNRINDSTIAPTTSAVITPTRPRSDIERPGFVTGACCPKSEPHPVKAAAHPTTSARQPGTGHATASRAEASWGRQRRLRWRSVHAWLLRGPARRLETPVNESRLGGDTAEQSWAEGHAVSGATGGSERARQRARVRGPGIPARSARAHDQEMQRRRGRTAGTPERNRPT
jgi:hypothetical protein